MEGFLQLPGEQRFTVSGILGTGTRPIRIFNVGAEANNNTGCVVYIENALTLSTANAYATLIVGTDNAYTIGYNMLDFHYGKRLPAGCYVHLSGNSGCTYATVTYHEEL